MGDRLVGPSPEPPGHAACSRWTVSELTEMAEHPADVTELLVVWKHPTCLVTRRVRSKVFYTKVKEKCRKVRVFTSEGQREGRGQRKGQEGDREPQTKTD